MDANGSRYQLLLGENDWLACSAEEARPGTVARPLSELVQPQLDSSSNLVPRTRSSNNLSWHTQRCELTLQERVFRFPSPANQIPPMQDARRGAASDMFANWYWIGPTNTEILVNSIGTKNTSCFWSSVDLKKDSELSAIGEFHPNRGRVVEPLISLSGLAITEDHYLVVGVLAPKGLLVFDLHSSGEPSQVFWPHTVDFEPFDMAAAPGGGVWILDRRNKCYWALDGKLRVKGRAQVDVAAENDPFQSNIAGTALRKPTCVMPQQIRSSDAISIDAQDPVAIEGLPDGTVLILDYVSDKTASLIRRYRFDEQIGGEIAIELESDMIDQDSHEDASLATKILAYDFAFVPEHSDAAGNVVLDRLYVATSQGDQCFAFLIAQAGDKLVLTPLSDYLPMRLFGGRGLVRGCCFVYYDSGGNWVPLSVQRRPRFAQEAVLYTPSTVVNHQDKESTTFDNKHRPPFDGREAGCVWHRVMLDAFIPPETKVRIWSRAADDPEVLIGSPWQLEPPLYLRGNGSELPFVASRTMTGDGTWELLLQNTRGRYLQLKLAVSGNGRSTPRLRALRAYYPRFSYLHQYLPAAYREDRESASFLDRYLANPEGMFTAIEDRIARVEMLFDPNSAPSDALDWLAAWFGYSLDSPWKDAKRRLFIQHAMQFFQYRGTVRGLQIALHLVLDDCITESLFNEPADGLTSRNPRRPEKYRIVERFRTRNTPGILFGDPSNGSQLRRQTTKRWQPDQGHVALHTLFNQKQIDAQISQATRCNGFPLQWPVEPKLSALWQSFCETTLGFIPSTLPADTARWQNFLLNRYHSTIALNVAYDASYSDFAQVPLPKSLPLGGSALVDWYQFHSIVLAMQQAAHRFTVLLPAPKEPDPDGSKHLRQLELANRVIELEKPAHTIFDIKFYWAYFRVGQARLGEDTIIDRGSRSVELMPPLILGRNYLAESYLAPTWPQDVVNRHVLGRDRIEY